MNFKYLIISTMLVSSTLNVALANEPTVSLGASIDFKYVNSHQSSGFTNSGSFTRRNHFIDENFLNLGVEASTDYGLKYGAAVSLADDTRSSVANGKVLAFRDSSLFIESNLGKLELGSTYGVTRTMKIDAHSIARATGGIDGSATDYMNNTVGYAATSANPDRVAINYITTPHSNLDTETGKEAYYNKINYYTPEIAGFQFGVSYSIDSAEVGGKSSLSGKFYSGSDAVDYKNVVSVGGNYKYNVDKISIQLGATGQFAKPEKMATAPALYQEFHNVNIYQVGALVNYDNFAVSGSYSNWNKSFNTKETDDFNNYKSRYYTLGAYVCTGALWLKCDILSI